MCLKSCCIGYKNVKTTVAPTKAIWILLMWCVCVYIYVGSCLYMCVGADY